MSKSPKTKPTDREVDALQHLLDDGFRPAMVIRTIPQADVEANLPRPYWDRTVRALPLARDDGEKRMFYFITPETAQLAECLVAEQRTVTGYALCIYCSAIGPDVVHGKTVDLTRVIPMLREQTGWDIRESKHPNVFEVHDEVQGSDQEPIVLRLTEVARWAVALSLRNGLGFHVLEHSAHPLFVGQSLKIVMGLEVRLPTTVSVEAYKLVAEIENDRRRYAAALALREIYSQVTPRTKLLIAWAAIEDLFPSRPEHLLSSASLDELVALLDRHSVIGADPALLARISGVLRKPDLVSKESRNERIAVQIAALLGELYGATYTRIRDAASTRGKLAHATRDDADVREHLEFFERVLKAVLNASVLFEPQCTSA